VRSLSDVGVTVDEISGSSVEASVAGLGHKAGTLTDLGNLQVLYVKHMQNIRITGFVGPLTCLLLSFIALEPRAIRGDTSFLQDNHCCFKASS